MRIKVFLLTVFVCLFSSYSIAFEDQINKNNAIKNASDQILPIRRVILYSNGVAYFERRGIVSGNVEIDLSFKQSQIDDVLKSMVVLDLGKGRIGAVSYNSSAPPSARMAEIPFSVSPRTNGGTGIGGMANVLSQLQGAKVAITSARGVSTGSILTVENRVEKLDKTSVIRNFLVLASDSGEISNFDLGKIKGIKLLDKDTQRDVREFADAAASSRRRDAKTISVTSEGTGARELVISYTVAAPIWKTTYRVVLDDKGKPFFQGWAIVDNISEEDWKEVKLSLVSGSPISFIQKIQKPFYRYRPVIPTPQNLNLSPQLYESGGTSSNVGTSISGLVVDQSGAVIPGAGITITDPKNGSEYQTTSDNNGFFSRSGLPKGSYTVKVNQAGFKSLVIKGTQTGSNLKIPLEVANVSAEVNVLADELTQLPINGRSPQDLVNSRSGFIRDGMDVTDTRISVSDALLSNNSGIHTVATGENIGDLFEYKIAQPITVLRNRSALIPIIQTKMEGERVSIYNESVRKNRPLGGMMLENTTPLTFEKGSLTVIDRNAYAGEALMKRLKPKEKRFISYALDLGTLFRVRIEQKREPAKLIRAVGGVFQIHFFKTTRKLYQISNQTDQNKTIFIEYPISNGWKLSSDTPEPFEKTQNFYRFRVELKPFENKDFTVSVQQPLMDSYQLNSFNKNLLRLFIGRRYIDNQTREVLENLISLREKISSIDQKLRLLNNEENEISRDQKRLRENIEALSKTAEAKQLISRYVRKADSQETRIEQITVEKRRLNEEKQVTLNQLTKRIKEFSFEKKT